MTTDIELPPLPESTWHPAPHERAFCPGQVEAYARAAIEADRRLRAIPGDMVQPTKFFIDEEMAGLLRQTIGDDGEPSAITLEVGDGHSGFGLYVSLTEYPEEGAIQLVECAAAPTAAAPAGGADGEAV